MVVIGGHRYTTTGLFFTGVVLFIVGLLIGIFSGQDLNDRKCDPAQTIHEKRKAEEDKKYEFHEKVYKELDTEEIKKNLKYFSARPHLGGTNRSKELALEIARRWRDYGFDKVEVPRYNVLLPHVSPNISNSVRVLDKNGSVELEFTGKEKTADPSEEDDNMIAPLLGYAKQGAANGTLLYVNYGRRDDFDTLRNTLNISDCKGKIVIMRYGKIFRGAKVQHAQDCGAVGVILYNDPEDYAPYGANKTYPDYIWLPSTGVQRGSILNGGPGDPLTPGFPSIDGVHRIPKDKAILPQIPATPLSYGEAVELLKLMKGTPVPDSWKGDLEISYKLGDGGLSDDRTITIKVSVPNNRQDIYNVIGTIYGKEEPDRWVMIGNHRDAWGFGAVDASSGTSTIMEISRALKDLLASGWRPRRTIKFCSWGAEESGLVGSTEWVETNQRLLSIKGVTYINVDSAVSGNYSFAAYGSPLLKTLLFDSVKDIRDPHAKSGQKMTVYERMVETSLGKVQPNYGKLGARSDYAAFYQFVGIPSVDMSYRGKDLYPVYHTVHDTYKWLQLVDPTFEFHLTTGRVASRLLMDTADSVVLPFDVTTYAKNVRQELKVLKKNHGKTLIAGNVTLRYLEEAATAFEKEAEKFKREKGNIHGSGKSELQIRNSNDRMVNVEKAFIYARGLPDRPQLMRHILFAPSISDTYSTTSFPGISDLLRPLNKTAELDWESIKQQVSVAYLSILQACHALRADAK